MHLRKELIVANRYLNTFQSRTVNVRAVLIRTWVVLLFSMSLLPLSGHAQLAGHNTLGDYGLQSGAQAPPGFYVVPMYYDYAADTLRNGDGDRFPTSGNGGSLDARAGILGLLWVGEKKFLGGNYGFGIWPAVTNNALEAPPFQLDSKTSTGLADLYIQPVILGWSKQAADFTAGVGIYAPTGDYEAGGDSNRGLGMWSLEFFGGATV